MENFMILFFVFLTGCCVGSIIIMRIFVIHTNKPKTYNYNKVKELVLKAEGGFFDNEGYTCSAEQWLKENL